MGISVAAFMCGEIFFLPRRSCFTIGFLQIEFFRFTFAPKYNNEPYKTSARGNKSKFITPKHISLPSRSVCQYLALAPVWDCPSSQGLESFKWEVTEHCPAAAVGSEGNEVSCAICIPLGFWPGFQRESEQEISSCDSYWAQLLWRDCGSWKRA